MPQDVNLSYQEIEQAATSLKREMEDLQNKATQLKTRIDNLTQTAFKTQLASPKFTESMGQFTKGLKDMGEGGKALGGFLTAAVSGFKDLDQQLQNGLTQK